MEVILASGYRPSEQIGLEADAQGVLWIDAQIHKLQSLGLTPIIVLAGEHCDEVVQKSVLLESCDLVYDSNQADANLLTNVKSGLKATERACFVIPAEVPVPRESIWKHLKLGLNHQGYGTNNHLLQTGGEGAPWQYGFPLLITPAGRVALLNFKNLTGLTDRRLNYFFSPPPALAEANLTL
jgi:hypothetical protein